LHFVTIKIRRSWPSNQPLLPFTGNDEADELLAKDANALLIGFVLDQQVPLQKAFSGPYELRKRIGTARCRQDRGDGPGEAR